MQANIHTIMYKYILHLNQLACCYVLSYVFLSISKYAVQNMNIYINIGHLIKIIVSLFHQPVGDLLTGSAPFRSVP